MLTLLEPLQTLGSELGALSVRPGVTTVAKAVREPEAQVPLLSPTNSAVR
jgi:hypothetical protein